MKNLGYENDDIIYLTLPEFLEKYKEIKKLPEEIQNSKYEFYEKYRQIKIKNVKVERDNLIQELGENITNPNEKIENNERKKIIKNLKNAEAELEEKILMKKNIDYDKNEKK